MNNFLFEEGGAICGTHLIHATRIIRVLKARKKIGVSMAMRNKLYGISC